MGIIDMRGKQCPMPVIEAKKALDQAAAEGACVTVRVDNEIAVENLSKLAKSRGMEIEVRAISEEDILVEFHSRCSAPGSGAPVQAAQLSPKKIKEEKGPECSGTLNPGRGLVVVISSDKMGEPEAELGRILMKGFLYALSKQEVLPETILFYNGGARLTTEDSDSLEDLKLMEEQGVELLTCGTCLKHLGLENSLQAGTVSNMYEIAEKLTTAGRVIRP